MVSADKFHYTPNRISVMYPEVDIFDLCTNNLITPGDVLWHDSVPRQICLAAIVYSLYQEFLQQIRGFLATRDKKSLYY